MRVLSPVILFVLAAVLAACAADNAAPYAAYAPRSGAYDRLTIQLSPAADPAAVERPVTITFAGKGGEEFVLPVLVRGRALVSAIDNPDAGLVAGEALSVEAFRSLVLASGVVLPPQFKIADAQAVLDLALGVADSGLTRLPVPAGFDLVETNMGEIR